VKSVFLDPIVDGIKTTINFIKDGISMLGTGWYVVNPILNSETLVPNSTASESYTHSNGTNGNTINLTFVSEFGKILHLSRNNFLRALNPKEAYMLPPSGHLQL